MVAVYLHEVSLCRILDMEWPFYQRVIKQLHHKLDFDISLGYAGNSFAKDTNKQIDKTFPFNIKETPKKDIASYGEQIANMLKFANVKILDSEAESPLAGLGITVTPK